MARGRIPFYEQQTSVGNVPGSPQAPVDDGLGRALVAAGSIGADLALSEQRRTTMLAEKNARMLEDRENRRAVADAAIRIQDADTQIATFARNTQAATAGDPDGYTAKVAKFADGLRDEMLGQVSNESGRLAMETHFASLRNRAVQQAMGWEAQRAIQFDADNAGNLVEKQAAELVRDPALVDAYRAISDMQLDASRLDAHARERLRDAREKAYRQAIGQGRLARDPADVAAVTGARLGVPEQTEAVPAVAAQKPATIEQSVGQADDATLIAAVIHQESGGRRYGVDGKILASEKGAQGEMQVMPGTAGDPGFGVVPARDGSPDELARVGRDYLMAMVREFGGDRMKALAAYNGGPGRVRAAVEARGNKWLSVMPAETRAYVAAIGASLAQKARPAPDDSVVAALDTGTLSDMAAKAGKVGDAWADSLSPDELVRFYREASTAVDRQQAAGRGILDQRVADAAVRADNGVRDAQPIPASAFIAAYGPVEGARRNYAYQQTQSYADDVQAVQGTPAAQVMATVAARNAAVNSPEPGAVARAATAQRYEKAARSDLQKREQDGAAYVIATAPSVKAAADRVFAPQGATGVPLWLDQSVPKSDRRAAMNDYLVRSQAEQARLGIRNVALLPAGTEAYIASAAREVAGSGDQMAATIAGMADTFGAFWPQVYRQVVGGKNGASVPDSFVVIPLAATPAGREEIARVDAVKVDDLKKQVTPDAPKAVSDGVQAALADYFQTMMPNAQNARSARAVVSVAEKIALSRVVGGETPTVAVRHAADILIGHLNFRRDGSLRSYAIPKAQDVQAVAAGVNVAMTKLGLWNLPSPPDLSGSRTPQEASEAWTQRVRANPVWVTNGDETGLLLYTVGENGQPAPVRWQDGSQVAFDWEALRSFARDSAADVAARAATVGTQGGVPTDRTALERERMAARQRAMDQERRLREGR